MLETTFEEARTHLRIVLGIELTDHLDFRRPKQLKSFALVGSLVVAYRYATVLGERIVIFDMSSGSHESHHIGTELDFDYGPDTHDAENQMNVIADMLRVREAIAPWLDAFRLGIYFDRMDDKEALKVKTFDDYKRAYDRVRYSMHLGVRYKFKSEDYKGKKLPAGGSAFVLWGKGGKGFAMSPLWTKRIRSWDIGFIKRRAYLVAALALHDFLKLDQHPPTVMFGAGRAAGPVL
jgi:hypothetical protein